MSYDMFDDLIEYYRDKPPITKESHRDESLTFDAGRGTWFVKNGKIWAKHDRDEILKIDENGKLSGEKSR